MLGAALVLSLVLEAISTELPWSSPHHYNGQPNGSYSPEWQDYFAVTDTLPNVTFELPRSWAGSVSVQSDKNVNNTAFFWAFEQTNGSFLSDDTSKPWGLWLAGGPGYSSMATVVLENGPITTSDTYAMTKNNYSWHQLADWVWVDNPVGVGYSTVGVDGYAKGEEDVAADLMSFFENFVEVFPNLKKRPLVLTGESYASRFITYWMKAYFARVEKDRPVTLSKIGIGNPAIHSSSVYENLATVQVMEAFPEMINYDTAMYDYVREQTHLCHFDINLTYPQHGGKFPTIHVDYGQLGRLGFLGTTSSLGSLKRDFVREVRARYNALPSYLKQRRVREEGRKRWLKERLGGQETTITANRRSNGSLSTTPGFNTTLTGKIDPWYGCDLFWQGIEYAVNWTYPWNELDTFDSLDVADAVNPITTILNPHDWMNDEKVRDAIHAPHNKVWSVVAPYYWDNKVDGSDPSVAPMAFMDELAANATANNITILWYSGNDDMLAPHGTTLVAIQNTTFGGTQGFSQEPTTSWYDDSGAYAGVIHQERGWVLCIVYGAGHQTPVTSPARSYVMAREFIVGNNPLGTVTSPGKPAITTTKPAQATQAVMLPDGVLVGAEGVVLVENATRTTTVTWPSETVAKWDKHLIEVFGTSVTSSTRSSTATTATTTTAGSL